MDNALLNRTIEFLLLPPGNFLTLFVLALFWRKRVMWVCSLLAFGFLQILILSMPVVSTWLLNSLENQYPPQAQLWQQQLLPQAIVVLGAGSNRDVPEYGGASTSLAGIERVRYAALLHRKTGLPILVSGGKPLPNTASEAELMRDILQNEFQVPVRWLEYDSHTTWQNAQFSDQMLSEAGIQSAWIVTQAWHMPRSLFAFQGRKVQYLPASTSFGVSIPWQDLHMNYIPQPTALLRSLIALHEWFGLAWYKLRSYLA